MKYYTVTSLVLVLLAAIPSTAASFDSPSPFPFVTDSFDPRTVINLIYAGRSDSALTFMESCARDHPEDPFVLLIKAKVLREKLNDEDNNKEKIRTGAEPIHDVISRAIDLCDEALGQSQPDPRFHFYRGYGWLGKAQLYVLTRSYWSAGRAASRGKSDLERYLEAYPDDPDAQGMLGAYLYFADAIPGFIKIMAKLLFIPGGDRDKGFDMLEYGATNDGLFSEDYRMILAAIDMVFEGKFEEGSEQFISLSEQYPYYTRLVEPISVVVPFSPLTIHEFGRIEARAIADYLSVADPSRDWSIVQRLRLNRAFTEMYFGSPAGAMNAFTVLIETPPEHPDWFLPIAMLNLGYFHQKTGEKKKARVAFESVKSNSDMSYYHDVAETMMESLDEPVKIVHLDDLEFIRQIYQDRPDSADVGLQNYRNTYGEDALYFFYEGDNNVFRQNYLAARHNFERALECREFGGDQIYQMFAALRLAEISGMEGRFGQAREHLDQAKKYCYANYLINFM
ncbi:MAG: tetratricopeptide repeat protein, partial [Candidatus Latescibacterota bacterium]